MRHIRFLTTLVALLVFVGDGLPRPDLPSTPTPLVRLHDEIRDPDQAEGIVEVFGWALDRYRSLGLELPEMTVTFHRGLSNCAGLDGYWTSSNETTRIDMCVVGEKQRKHTLLHEFAHAWVADQVGQDERDAFLARRGLRSWNAADVDHDSRGMEQAAEIIAWGLDERCEDSEWLSDMDQAELAAEFRRLTGLEPICSAT